MEEKKRIIIDARMINMSGIGTYIKELLNQGIYTDALGNEMEITHEDPTLNTITYNEKIYGIKEQLHFPYKKIKQLKPYALHVPHYNVPIFYHGRMYVTIHDLTHLVLKENLPNKFAYIYARVMLGIAIHKAKAVITVSENTKKDILKFYKSVNPNKIQVIYHSLPQRFHIKKKKDVQYLYSRFNIPKSKKILMYVGNLKPHKNLARLVEAYSNIRDIDETRLLLVGKAFDSYNLDELIQKRHVEKYILTTGIVSDEELVDLYNLTDLFVFPSLYEGFGLPPLEAMACGTPVVCSNSSCMPEIIEDAAIYFDPLDIKEIQKAIEIGLTDDEIRKELIENGKNQCLKYQKREFVNKTTQILGG